MCELELGRDHTSSLTLDCGTGPVEDLRMLKTSLVVAVMMVASAGVASAGGHAGSIGVGAEYQLSGTGGGSVNYDAGQFHVGGFLGFFDPPGANNTVFEIGGRFFWHVHSTAMSDFGLGGNLGIASVPFVNNQGNNDHHTDVFLEPGFQIRLFLVPNVALSFTGGLVIGVVDASGVAITGQGVAAQGINVGPGAPTNIGFNAGAGIHYYFF
jgi:hypothetical protein